MRYVKFEDRHKSEVQALVKQYFIPFYFKFLQITKDQITPEMAKLRPIFRNDCVADFANNISFVCENDKGNVIAAILNSYLNEEEFIFRAVHQFGSFLQLPMKHPIGGERFALSKLRLYKDIKLFEKQSVVKFCS